MMLHTGSFLLGMRKNQWLPKKELEELQLKRLKSIVKHVYDTVPYYHELFKKNNLSPSDIKSLKDIEKIPVTTKMNLVNSFPHEIISKTVTTKSCSFERTSGSTGFALNVARSPETKEYELALFMHALFECGLKLRDKMLVFEDPRNFRKDRPSILNKMGLLRKENASVFDPPEKLLEKIQVSKPDVIYGHPSTIFLVSQLMKKKKIRLNKKPRFIVSTSETLHKKFREEIEEQFGCDVFDHYGSTEFPRMAWQCKEKKHLHINADSHIIEFLNKGRPSKQGEVVVTSLYNYGMPLIRYALNDVSGPVDGNCPCGRSLTLMKSIEGRKDDFVVNSNGTALSPKVLCFELDEVKSISEYRLVQKKAGSATLCIVKNEHFDTDELNQALKRISNYSKNRLKIKVVYKKRIAREKRKLQMVISSVKTVF